MNGRNSDDQVQDAGIGQAPPVLRIVSGRPTPQEIAAVTVVLTAMATAPEEQRPAPSGAWSDLSLRLRRQVPPGPGAWRNSAWT